MALMCGFTNHSYLGFGYQLSAVSKKLMADS
jgi:hypothetical protein